MWISNCVDVSNKPKEWIIGYGDLDPIYKVTGTFKQRQNTNGSEIRII